MSGLFKVVGVIMMLIGLYQVYAVYSALSSMSHQMVQILKTQAIAEFVVYGGLAFVGLVFYAIGGSIAKRRLKKIEKADKEKAEQLARTEEQLARVEEQLKTQDNLERI